MDQRGILSFLRFETVQFITTYVHFCMFILFFFGLTRLVSVIKSCSYQDLMSCYKKPTPLPIGQDLA